MRAEAVDQIFVALKGSLLVHVPGAWQPIASAVLSVVPVLLVFPLLFAVTTVLERKGLARMQNRYGPNRVGPFGFAQPAADGIKSLTKEDVVPFSAEYFVHLAAPLLLVLAAFLSYAVLPVGRNMVIANLNAGVLFFFAVGSMVELAVFMAGWSSRSKYSLLGAMRAVAQMISYEVPLVLAATVVIMASGSLSNHGHRGDAGTLHRHLATLVRVHALGIRGLCAVHDRRHGRGQPRAVRPARR